MYIIILDIRIPQPYALLYTTTGTLSVIIQIQRVRSIARWYPCLFGRFEHSRGLLNTQCDVHKVSLFDCHYPPGDDEAVQLPAIPGVDRSLCEVHSQLYV